MSLFQNTAYINYFYTLSGSLSFLKHLTISVTLRLQKETVTVLGGVTTGSTEASDGDRKQDISQILFMFTHEQKKKIYPEKGQNKFLCD